MSLRISSKAAGLLALILFTCPRAGAQTETGDRVRETWNGPDPSLVAGVLRGAGRSRAGTTAPRLSAVKFTPAGDSGVAKSLADALGGSAEERAALAEAFGQIKQGYEAEVAKEGKSNNLAAAMTFFISVNVAAYHHADLPSEEAGEKLFQSLQETLAAAPEFARLTDAEKHRMHDWLVCMAGFVLTGYADAKQKGDREAASNFAQLADYSMRVALGVEVGKMSLGGNGLSIEGGSTGRPTTGAAENKIVGVWSISAGNHAGTNLVTNAGYSKGQYQFKPDGTYAFKSERWFGYARSKEFYTTEESGTYTVSGDTLTVSPKTSKTTLRSPEGVVQKTQNNPLERVTYKWQLHHFEGIDETQLVLRPPKETARDGGFSSSTLFPNSYLYSPSANLEWRF